MQQRLADSLKAPDMDVLRSSTTIKRDHAVSSEAVLVTNNLSSD